MEVKMSTKKAWVIIVLFLILVVASNHCSFVNAQSSSSEEGSGADEKKSQIVLEVDEKNPQTGEEIILSIRTKNVSVAAGTLWIYFASENLEVIEKPENSNVVNNTIVYTWFNENGKNRSDDFVINQFIFKAKNNGISLLTAQAELFNEQGEQLKVNVQSVEIQIGEDITQIQNLAEVEEGIQELQTDDENNSSLAILRLNQEGINPVFDKNIKEYYITIPKNIDALEVTAIPENENSTVTITGNQNLKNGANTIQINVQSENEKNNSQYQIFVTKTNNTNTANANLETLAIENVTLSPDYQEEVTNYTASVTNDVESLNILAIPQNQNAKVTISGNDNLKEGDNTVTVTVTAENGVTFKKYGIIVHKMSEQEMKEQEEKSQTEQNQNVETSENEMENVNATLIDNAKEIEQQQEEKQEVENNNYLLWIGGVIVALIVVGVVVIMIRRKRSKYYKY